MELSMHSQTTAEAPAKRPAFKVKEVAELLGIDTSTVYAEIKANRLSAYRVGQGRGTFRISRSAVKQYADERGIPAAELGVEL
ncbi:hypothetical protein AN219_37650 [Streptomyces nanshensis]|nr:hypothetical protein AN219_37650 [Streptomyces nanshensis]